ncbi:MAG: hypothetical protein JXR15_17315 [Shimia sp.]|uniref:hypothetical protein n=1 Tax=Shimia sp. TaxID=1954381 RepID=UPI003B8DB7D8
MSDPKVGTFEDLVELTPKSTRPITNRLNELLLSVDENACFVVRLGDRAETYGVGPKKMSEGYCYILLHSDWVNLGFYKGAELPDPTGLLQGTGAKMRHIKMRVLADCHNPHVHDLIVVALKERKAALGQS